MLNDTLGSRQQGLCEGYLEGLGLDGVSRYHPYKNFWEWMQCAPDSGWRIGDAGLKVSESMAKY